MASPGTSRIIVLVLGFYAPGLAAVRVRIVNKAQAPHEVVTSAQRMAAGIFSAARIQTAWAVCVASQCQPLAASKNADGAIEILMVINQDATPGCTPGALGISLPSIGDGNRAGVFYSRIEAVSREQIVSLGASVAEILAHAMAHEIGHLLLNWSTHAQEGLMRASWTAVEFHAMRSYKLFFSAGEAGMMRRAIAKRSSRRNERRARQAEQKVVKGPRPLCCMGSAPSP
jgi:hypothetical protein